MVISEIKSPQNKRLREFLRKRDDFFCFSGEKLVNDIMAGGRVVDLLVVLDSFPLPVHWPRAMETWLVSPEVMARVSSLREPAKAAAIIKKLPAELDFHKHSRIIVLHNVQDPGNAGTICRCAAAFGFDAVVLTGTSVKINNEKFLRSAQTSLFTVNVLSRPEIEKLLEQAVKFGFRILVTSSSRQVDAFDEKIVKPPFLIIFGSEGSGLPRNYFDLYPALRLAQKDNVESLNVAVAACIIMHELTRKDPLRK